MPESMIADPAALAKAVESSTTQMTREVEYAPRGLEAGFTVEIMYTPGRAWRKLSARVKTMAGNDRAREFAMNKGEEQLLAGAIQGWRGLTPEHFLAMLDVDESVIPEGAMEIGFGPELAQVLVRECGDFKLFIFDQMSELQAFRDAARAEARKN